MIGNGVLQQKGLICFEEITDYSILDDFKKKTKKRKEPEPSDDVQVSESKKPKVLVKKEKKKSKKKKVDPGKRTTSTISLHDAKDSSTPVDTAELEEKMAAWSDMVLPKKILRGLYDKGYYQPTPIQKLVLPEAIKNKSNIIGTAQTGSGKTLAFGLPILAHLHDFYLTKEKREGPLALILTPTRELALQVKDHLQAACKHMKTKIVGLVGGISLLKQERLLSKKPDIIVATPGRLMQLIDDNNEFLLELPHIKYLVIDEADRMIERGHFREMTKILGLVNSDPKAKAKRQNFLFSATLITKFSGDYDELDPAKKEKTEKQQKKEEKALLRELVEKIQMAKEPKMFDLTTKAVTAENLYESKIFCPKQEKDIYLYYFLCKYKGRTLVFSNSIDCVRRLTNLFRLLRRTPLHLHANMNQKQRLKNLERFNADENSVLIASDVASRGLDIPNVQHVIHYQVPRSAEIYVHRSGRTARSTNEGLSVMLVSPDELQLYRKILKTFNRESDIKDYPIDNDYFDECKSRVNLAIKIDKLEHQMGKEKSNANWYEKHAKLLDIELDDEIMKETHQDNDQLQKNKQKLYSWKQELKQALDRTIFPKFMSRKYLHPDSVKKVADINDSSSTALNEFKDKKKKKKNVVC